MITTLIQRGPFYLYNEMLSSTTRIISPETVNSAGSNSIRVSLVETIATSPFSYTVDMPILQSDIPKSEDAEAFLPLSDVCQYIGKSSLRPSQTPASFHHLNYPFYKYLKFRGFSSDTPRDVYRSMISGGIGSILSPLREMCLPNSSSFSYSEITSAISGRIGDLSLPLIGNIGWVTMKNVRLKADSFSGFISSMLSGSTRRTSFSFSYGIANGLYKELKLKDLWSSDVWTYGVRPKLCKTPNTSEYLLLKARPLALCETSLAILAGCVVQQITDVMVASPHTPLFIGRPMNHTDIKWLSDYMEGDEEYKHVINTGKIVNPKYKYYSPDWSQYDTSVYRDLLISSMSLISTMFYDSQFKNRLLSYILSSMVSRNTIFPDGHIYKISKGIPSGHPFTTLIGTMSNWIVWQTIWKDYCIRENIEIETSGFKIVVSGDDTILRLPASVDEESLWLSIQKSGLVCDDIRGTSTTFYSYGSTRGVNFLRRFIYPDHTVDMDKDYISSKLAYNERKNLSYAELLAQAEEYLTKCNGATSSQSFLIDYLCFLRSYIHKLVSGRGLTVSQIFSRLSPTLMSYYYKCMADANNYRLDIPGHSDPPKTRGIESRVDLRLILSLSDPLLDKDKYVFSGFKRFFSSVYIPSLKESQEYKMIRFWRAYKPSILKLSDSWHESFRWGKVVQARDETNGPIIESPL